MKTTHQPVLLLLLAILLVFGGCNGSKRQKGDGKLDLTEDVEDVLAEAPLTFSAEGEGRKVEIARDKAHVHARLEYARRVAAYHNRLREAGGLPRLQRRGRLSGLLHGLETVQSRVDQGGGRVTLEGEYIVRKQDLARTILALLAEDSELEAVLKRGEALELLRTEAGR
jgi:hypothetical protein